MTTPEIRQAMEELLFPLVTILTPNIAESRKLALQADSIDACAQEILSKGPEFVLITGTEADTEKVENRLYGNRRLLETYYWDRLPASYHGSGCTLSSAIAGLLSQGQEPFTAILEAQEYTWETLKYGYQIGAGQHIPNRFFWSHDESNLPVVTHAPKVEH